MEASLLNSALIALTVGAASGAIGAFIILRRMALVGDALSHVALPGIALALMWGVDPFWGVIVFLIAAAVIVWWLGGRTTLPGDAIVGLLFTASLAVGILLIPNQELVESLFGAFPALSPFVLWLVIGTAAILTILIFWLAQKFLFMIVSPDLARVEGVSKNLDLILLVIFSLVVALGIKLVGTLLMGALTIIPALIAKNISASMKSYITLSAIFGAGIALAGVVFSYRFLSFPGPTIILIGVGLFIVSLAFKKNASV